jgi:hypothetical protein
MAQIEPIDVPLSNDVGFTFPQDFGFYRSSRSDMVIALHKNQRTLFYISTHNRFSSQPSVVLHSGPSPENTPLATADFRPFGSSIDLKAGTDTASLTKESVFSSHMYFSFPVEGKMEKFEWRRSAGPEVQSLCGSSRGMKLVRVLRDQTLAAWAGPRSGRDKVGKMRLLVPDRTVYGERFEVMVIISIVAIMEKARRTKGSAAAAGAAAGAAGGGGA